MAEVELRGLTKIFDHTEVIKGLDLMIPDGQFTVLVGPSGCGKSTLLRLIAGLEEPSSGEIFIDGQSVANISPAQRGIAMVFQSYALYPHMNVFDNMAFGLKLAKTDRHSIRQRVEKAAEALRISGLLARKPRELSGGQRQRVAIGRAVTRRPRVFLFDEPLSNLDAALRVQMRLELARLQRDLATTMVYVTHDQSEAMILGHQIVVLKDGRIEQQGRPLEIYQKPTNRFVAEFIGSPQMNFLDVQVSGHEGHLQVLMSDGTRLELPALSLTGGPVSVGIRPEDVAVDPHGELLGKVDLVERLGAESHIHLRLADGTRLTASQPGTTRLQPGESVRLAVPVQKWHFFGSDGKRIAASEPDPASGIGLPDLSP